MRFDRSLLCLAAIACSSNDAPAPITGTNDAGVGSDANVIIDAESPGDGSSEPDAGTVDAQRDATDAALEPPDLLTCRTTGALANGRTYCEANVGGLWLRITDKQRVQGPARLLLFLHADGGSGHFDNAALALHVAWADAHNARVVSALAPNGCSWWQTPTHNCASSVVDSDSNGDNAGFLHGALTELKTKVALADAPIFVHADSGGSIFVSYQFIPKYGNQYPGRYAINCGGVGSPLALRFTPTPAYLAATRLDFTYGDQDFLGADARSSYNTYVSRGFDARETILPNTTHCAFNTSARSEVVFDAP